ncbi:hypothetical protein IFM89_011277 [Coptis chinensis]|uniref:Uncharacterized protein n=1 Tax=Coptis chinensis TaxID=261450 RepID=A0A835HE30_9MAGN|nr:hypothetical protein IFM89_011277 [Coptis chinensis]
MSETILNSDQNDYSFENFFHERLVTQQHYLNQLLLLSSQNHHDDELPALAFRVVNGSFACELNNEQVAKIQTLETDEATESAKLGRIQESTAGPSWMRIVGPTERHVSTANEANAVIETLSKGLKALIITADSLRATTVKGLVDILSPFKLQGF